MGDTVTFVTTSFSPFALGGAPVQPGGWQLAGTAVGGTIDFAIGAVLLQVTTLIGQSAATVAANIAAAINTDPTLSAAGIVAQSEGRMVTTNGAVTLSVLDDPGLTHVFVVLVPALRGWHPALFGLIVIAAAFVQLRRRASSA